MRITRMYEIANRDFGTILDQDMLFYTIYVMKTKNSDFTKRNFVDTAKKIKMYLSFGILDEQDIITHSYETSQKMILEMLGLADFRDSKLKFQKVTTN